MEAVRRGAIWVIDTGSIIQIRRALPVTVRARVVGHLNDLVENGSIVYPPEVVSELERVTEKMTPPDIPFDWAKSNSTNATRFGHLFEEVRQVLARVEDLVDPKKVSIGGIDDADPHVVALGVKLRRDGEEVTIITEDYNSKPTKTSLADAAGVFRVPCVRFVTFLKTEQIWDGREGT